MANLLKAGIFFLCFCSQLYAQEGKKEKDDWTERRTTADGDKVYVRRSKTTGYFDVRLEADLPGTINSLFAVLSDLDKFPTWAYSVRVAKVVTWKSKNNLIYYAEYGVPWPLSNRDEYAEVKFTEDTVKHTARITGTTLKDYAPEKKGIVRLTMGKGVWDIITITPKKIHLTYVLQIDPGGSIPPWIVNLFITKAPTETLKGLRGMLKKELNKGS